MQQLKDAFGRVAHICIGSMGDAYKSDLKQIAYGLGMTDTEIHQNYPELFREEAGVEDTQDEMLESQDTDDSIEVELEEDRNIEERLME